MSPDAVDIKSSALPTACIVGPLPLAGGRTALPWPLDAAAGRGGTVECI